MDGGVARRTWTSKAALLMLKVVLWMQGCWRRATRPKRRNTGTGNTPRNLTTVAIVLPNSEDVEWQLPCIAKTTLWCSSLGVQEIVLHDPRGQLKKHMNTFVDHILALAEVIDPIVGCVRCRYSFPAKNGSKAKCILPGGRNYVEDKFELRTGITREALRLHIICEKDSYLSLLEAACLPASELVPLAQTGSGNAAETNGAEMLTARGLDQQLRALGSYLPDPQLVMVLGEDTNLAGYPPWNIQVSEIYCLGPATRISKKHIARVVHRYFCTMQRFGK